MYLLIFVPLCVHLLALFHYLYLCAEKSLFASRVTPQSAVFAAEFIRRLSVIASILQQEIRRTGAAEADS